MEMTFELIPKAISQLQEDSLFIKNELANLKHNFQPIFPTEYLTPKEVADMLKCDLSTVHNWKKKKILIPYGIGSRVYYKRSEIEAALVPFGKK